MMTVLSKTQAPATAPVTDAMAAQIPAPTSKAGPSYEPQLLQPQTQVSEITAHVKTEIPTGETKSELLPVPLGSNTQPGLSVSTQIEGGGSETKTTGVKFPQDSSGVIPAANSGTANY
ncbi:hypothetical protein E2542_SST13539 [Spatholobus suberectus]|nr:hypothetical protein E2542_SST13539 [Spatholobus suberectus]